MHIYNQTSWLTRMGLEFRIFGGCISRALLVGHRVPQRQRPVQPHDGTACSVAGDEGPGRTT